MASTMAGNLPSPLKKLEEQLTCAVCLQLYTDPKTLPCLHSFCQQCLEGLPLDPQGDINFIACPTCHHRTELPEPAGVAGFPVAFHLDQLKEIYSQMKKATDATPQIVVCSSHNEPLKVFCETCDEIICFQCVAESHKNHEWNLVTDSYRNHCQKLELGLNPVREKAEAIQNVLTALTERENEIRDQGETVKEEIHAMVKEMIDTLRQSERQLTEEVEAITNSKLQVLSGQKKSAEMSLSQLKDCEDYVEQSLKIGTPHQVLSSKTQMTERMSQVTQQTNVEEFNPLEKADIQLIKDSKLVETIDHVGDIMSTTLQQCKMKEIAQVEQQKEKMVSFTMSLELPDSSPLTVPLSSLSCTLVPAVGKGQPITATVTSTNDPGVYRIHCSPSTGGYHQVNVQVYDVQLKATSHMTLPSIEPLPEPPKTPSPEPPRAPSPEPPKAPSPEPPKAPSPEPPKASSPEPPKAPSPDLFQAPSQEPPKAPSPESPKAPSPEPPKAPSPEPPKAPSPEPPEAPSPDPFQAPSPEPPKAPSPEPPEAPSLEPPEALSPEPSSPKSASEPVKQAQKKIDDLFGDVDDDDFFSTLKKRKTTPEPNIKQLTADEKDEINAIFEDSSGFAFGQDDEENLFLSVSDKTWPSPNATASKSLAQTKPAATKSVSDSLFGEDDDDDSWWN